MTKEEEEAIEQLKSWREFIINNKDKVNKSNDREFNLRRTLNLEEINEEELEKEEYKYRDLKLKYGQNLKMTKHFREELQKQDKTIDLMAEHIVSSAIVDDTVCGIKYCEIEEDCTHEKMLKCTKQYFERKVEK